MPSGDYPSKGLQMFSWDILDVTLAGKDEGQSVEAGAGGRLWAWDWGVKVQHNLYVVKAESSSTCDNSYSDNSNANSDITQKLIVTTHKIKLWQILKKNQIVTKI